MRLERIFCKHEVNASYQTFGRIGFRLFTKLSWSKLNFRSIMARFDVESEGSRV